MNPPHISKKNCERICVLTGVARFKGFMAVPGEKYILVASNYSGSSFAIPSTEFNASSVFETVSESDLQFGSIKLTHRNGQEYFV